MATEGYSNWERFYHKYNLIFNGLVAVPLVPFAFVYLETQSEFPDPPLIEGATAIALQVILMVIGAVCIVFSEWYMRGIKSKLEQVESVPDRLNRFISEKVKQFAMLEFASVCALAGLYLLKISMFGLLYLAVLFIYSLRRPTFDGIARETGLPEDRLLEWGNQKSEK